MRTAGRAGRARQGPGAGSRAGLLAVRARPPACPVRVWALRIAEGGAGESGGVDSVQLGAR